MDRYSIEAPFPFQYGNKLITITRINGDCIDILSVNRVE